MAYSAWENPKKRGALTIGIFTRDMTLRRVYPAHIVLTRAIPGLARNLACRGFAQGLIIFLWRVRVKRNRQAAQSVHRTSSSSSLA